MPKHEDKLHLLHLFRVGLHCRRALVLAAALRPPSAALQAGPGVSKAKYIDDMIVVKDEARMFAQQIWRGFSI